MGPLMLDINFRPNQVVFFARVFVPSMMSKNYKIQRVARGLQIEFPRF
jgi:hypothetical protein